MAAGGPGAGLTLLEHPAAGVGCFHRRSRQRVEAVALGGAALSRVETGSRGRLVLALALAVAARAVAVAEVEVAAAVLEGTLCRRRRRWIPSPT